MKFTKMQGLGNDYVYVNGFTEKIENPSEVAVQVSDRHFGIGSDGLIPVSYTHLVGELSYCRRMEAQNEGIAVSLLRAHMPVSYTHLDVYKRQMRDFWLRPGDCF